jgi:hypothetical protein
MALHLNQLSYDSHQNLATVTITENDVPNSQKTITTFFTMNTTGNETQNQINDMLKQKTKELLLAAAAVL